MAKTCDKKGIVDTKVFAKRYIKPGFVIPIIGMAIPPEHLQEFPESQNTFHWTWTFQKINNDTFRTSVPHWLHECTVTVPTQITNISTLYQHIPLWGFAIYKVIRQVRNVEDANVVFWNNHVLIIRAIQPGTELLLFQYNLHNQEKKQPHERHYIEYQKKVIRNSLKDPKNCYNSIVKTVQSTNTYKKLNMDLDRYFTQLQMRFEKFIKKHQLSKGYHTIGGIGENKQGQIKE